MCRNRRYVELTRVCILWKEFVKFSIDHRKNNKSMKYHRTKFLIFYNVLKPKRWYIASECKEYGFAIRCHPEGAKKGPAFDSWRIK